METFSSHFDIPVINHQFEKSQFVIHHQFRVHGRDYLLTELVIYNSFFSTKHSELVMYHKIEIFQTGDL